MSTALIGETQGRPGSDDTRVFIKIDEQTRRDLNFLLYQPMMRGVGYSEFLNRAIARAIEEYEERAEWDGPPYRESKAGR